MSSFQVSQRMKQRKNPIRAREKSSLQLFPLLLALTTAPLSTHGFSTPHETCRVPFPPVAAKVTTECASYGSYNTQLNARPNVSMLSSESYTDDEDEYTDVWTTPEIDRENRDRKEKEKGKKTRKEIIEKILQEDEEEWMGERKKKVEDRRKAMKVASERDRKEKLTSAQLAEKVGVTITELEPTDDYDTSNPIQLNLPTQRKNGWFDEIDREIDRELEEDEEPIVVNGEIIESKKRVAKKKGILVGSAGGWSLEVFPGDFVVHRKYGIGRFEKTALKSKANLSEEELDAQSKRRQELIQKLRDTFPPDLSAGDQQIKLSNLVQAFGTEDDTDPVSNPQISVLEIAYTDALVHVPIERAYRLSRYRAGDAAIKPRLSRVRGEAWKKAKARVMESTAQLAEDVLALYATRETLQRTPFSPLLESKVEEFAKTFPYEPTPDQITCFDAVENDMVWRKRPMDRLVCGDVGFGKTEVALRAIHRCVVNKRQAAFLAPTGVLAAQHFKSACNRMEKEFGIKVGLLRGGMNKTTKAGREIREKIKSGEIELIVGTHALLSNNLEFKDLGLLVVDEEQRFGVKQKERLKLICNGIDVLTLSATPIPRTLQMSLSGIRDTSTIRSPPPMRKPTLTQVEEFNEDAIKQAIQTELDRNGQVFYVVPRIAMLEDASILIRKLFPDIELIMAHGRMPKQGAEENVARFAEGEGTVLLATTVIENGVDIPTVNTIIVQDAQSFGMSTLYQLRGRVGRSNLQAYAYFLYKEDILSEQGAARLQAMADLHELGSGFDVANRDLEIRGAGSLLGTEQSGMAARVGFDLYMRMLKKSIRQLRRLDLPTVPRTNVILPYGEGSLEGKKGTSTFSIPKEFIEDDEERLRQEGAARLAESTDKLVELTQTWKETYGPLPPKLQANMKTLHLHVCTRQLGIDLAGSLKSEESGSKDFVLRAPGIRARHWARICASLPRKQGPKGLDLVIPARFSSSKTEIKIEGGTKVNWKEVLKLDEDDDDEIDNGDEEEVEAMKIVSSAASVTKVTEDDINEFSHFIIEGLGSVKRGARVDAILKVLLPVVKIVAKNQAEDKERAQMAVELRDKREIMKKQRKEQNDAEQLRKGYMFTEEED